jgi:hypothetical protein
MRNPTWVRDWEPDKGKEIRLATYKLKRSEVRDAIVARLESESAIVDVLKWDESELRYIASDICDDLGINDDE